jgi:hypothetical protein
LSFVDSIRRFLPTNKNPPLPLLLVIVFVGLLTNHPILIADSRIAVGLLLLCDFSCAETTTSLDDCL